jgi:RNA polymerase sigma-70 factor (ECF subfamily)
MVPGFDGESSTNGGRKQGSSATVSMNMTSPPASGEMPKLPTDAELLEQTTRGSEAAFKELVNRHGRYLFGIAHSLSGNASDAEDLVQETLIGALSSRFRGESAVRTWLVGILVRRAGMLHRTRKRQARSFSSGEFEGNWDASALKTVPEASGSTDAKLDLSVMLARLSPEHREVIVLRELEGMTYEQIAAALGVPRGTVESRLHRAREELRKRFKGYEP